MPVRVAPVGGGTPSPGDALWVGNTLAGFITSSATRGGRAGCGGLALAGALWGGGRVAPPRLGRRHKKKGDGGSGRPATLHAAVRIVPGDGCGRPEFGGAAVPVHGPVGVAWRRESGGV